MTAFRFCAVAILATSVCPAATVFTSRSAWEAAVGSFTTETFTNPIPDIPFPNAPTITFDNGTVSRGFNGTAQNGVCCGGFFSADIDTSGDFAFLFDRIEWTFPYPVIAFGLDLFEVSDGTVLLITGNFDGTGNQSLSALDLLGSPGTGFIGVVGGTGFTTLEFTEQFAVRNGIGAEGFAADNLSLAPEVPEPGTLSLLGAGLAVTALSQALRRRQRGAAPPSSPES